MEIGLSLNIHFIKHDEHPSQMVGPARNLHFRFFVLLFM